MGLARATVKLDGVFVAGAWLALYYWWLVPSSGSSPSLLVGLIGALIVIQIIVFFRGMELDQHREETGESWNDWVVGLGIFGLVVLILGSLAGSLAIVPGLARLVAAFLIGAENYFVYDISRLAGARTIRTRWNKLAFGPIALLALLGAWEVWHDITTLGCS